MTNQQRRRYYADYQRELNVAEAYAYARFKALLGSQLRVVLRSLSASGLPATYANIDQMVLPTQTAKVFVRVMVKTGEQFAKWIKPRLKTEKRAGPELSFGAGFFSQTFIDQMTDYALNVAGSHITSITDTTRKIIKESLADSARNNYDIRTTAKRLREAVGGQILKNRALLIARTETTSAANHGQYLTAKGYGIELQKEWIATRDSRTRDAHSRMDGKLVGMEERFDVGGRQMKYPGDPAGGASNVCNCRCCIAFVPADEMETVLPPIVSPMTQITNLIIGGIIAEVVE